MLASTRTTAAWIASATRGAAPRRSGSAASTAAAPAAPRAIQAASPSRRNRTRPAGPPKTEPVRTRRRSAS
ncbi:MAG TPA: hypothetical protein DCQ64_12490 [Candidatus Rokubacteria bacterium]|nr:hypothetical protein [Candidatus Rokubacteria bacterium]